MLEIKETDGKVGVIKLGNWDTNFNASVKNRSKWVEYMENMNGTNILKVKNYEDDKDIQDQSWDGIVYYKGKKAPERIEFKTGSINNYKKYFLTQNKPVLFETISNIELDRYSSSIWNCNAEIYAYGFGVDDIIVEPTFINMEKFKKFFTKSYFNTLKKWQYPFKTPGKIYANTNNLYNTESVLIPQELLIECFHNFMENEI